MRNTEIRRRNDDAVRFLHDFRKIIAEAQRHGLPSLFEERKSEGTFQTRMGWTTIESKFSARDAITQLVNADILSPNCSRLSDIFTAAIEEIAPQRNFSDLSTTEIVLVARSFNARKFSS